MPAPQVFRAVRRGTAALNVLDLVEVAGQFAGCEALARLAPVIAPASSLAQSVPCSRCPRLAASPGAA